MSSEKRNGDRFSHKEIIKFLLGVMQVILIGLMTWTLIEVTELSNRVGKIETQIEFVQELNALRFDDLDKDIEEIKKKLP